MNSCGWVRVGGLCQIYTNCNNHPLSSSDLFLTLPDFNTCIFFFLPMLYISLSLPLSINLHWKHVDPQHKRQHSESSHSNDKTNILMNSQHFSHLHSILFCSEANEPWSVLDVFFLNTQALDHISLTFFLKRQDSQTCFTEIVLRDLDAATFTVAWFYISLNQPTNIINPGKMT